MPVRCSGRVIHRSGASLLGGICLSLFFCSCVVTRHAPRAGELVEWPSHYALAPVEGRHVRNISDVLDAPELGRLIDRAFSGNMNLRATWARVSRTEAAAREARAGLFPGVQASLEAERSNVPSSFGFEGGDGSFPGSNGASGDIGLSNSTENRFTGSLGAGYEIDLWGRLRGSYAAALLDAEAARRDAEALAVSLAAEVAEAWASLAARRERDDILARQIEASERILELTRLRFEKGLVGAQDVAQQAQETESIRGQRILLQGRLRVAKHRLALLIGEAPGNTLKIAQGVLPVPPPLTEPGIPSELLGRRPDVRAARLRLESADERTAAAVADRLPRLRLTANLFDQAQNLGDLLGDLFWSVAGSAEQEIYTGGRRAAVIAGAEAGAEALLFDYGQTLLEALREVQDGLVLTQRQEVFVGSLARQLELATTAFEAALRRYRQGDVDFVNVLIGLQTAHTVELELLDARQELYSSRVQLWRALGGDWGAGAEEENGER